MIEFAWNAIGGATGAVVGWFALHMLGKPILALRAARFEALKLAERYAYFGGSDSQDEAYINNVRRRIFNIGSELRTHARAHSKLVHFYCRIMGYNLEEAATALIGLGGVVGLHYDKATRTNTLTHVYVSLGAGDRVPHKNRLSHKAALAAEAAAAKV